VEFHEETPFEVKSKLLPHFEILLIDGPIRPEVLGVRY